MAIFSFPLAQAQIFFLIMLRISATIVFLPIFSSRNIPMIFKIGLALCVSFILFPILTSSKAPFIIEPVSFLIGIAGEIIIGVIIGLCVRLIFTAVQLSGQLVGFQMGFAIANVMDPVTSSHSSIIAQLNNLIALMIFLAVNAHHLLLQGMVESFRLVPLFGFSFSNSLMEQFMKLSCNMFIIAIKIGSPIIVALLLTSVAFGLIARTVPQMNIFIVAMPLKIVIGMLFLALSLPFLSNYLRELFNGLGNTILLLLNAM